MRTLYVYSLYLHLLYFRYSMMQSKRIFWQYEIEGQRDMEKEVEKLILETTDEYKKQAETTNKAIRTVRLKIFIE